MFPCRWFFEPGFSFDCLFLDAIPIERFGCKPDRKLRFLLFDCSMCWRNLGWKGPQLPDEAVCDTARMPHVEDLMSPCKMISCCATGRYYTSIADLRYAVCIYHIHTVILQRFWIINFPLQAASSPEDVQWRRLGRDFSDGYPPNEWLAKAHPSQVPKILCWPGRVWRWQLDAVVIAMFGIKSL